ncbi:MAG: hypothetical protein ACE5LF_06310 [Alphaproteobacteria bacterium]
MTGPVKFMFETVFELEDDGGNGHGVGLSHTYTREELNAAREEARQAGFAGGVAQAQASIERRHADALNAIAERLTEIARVQADEFERTVKGAATLSLAIARKVAPALMRQQPLAEIEAMIADHLAQLIDEPRVVVRVPDDLLDALKCRIDEIAAGCGYAGRAVLLADPSLGDADCHMEWADGGAERNTDAVWREVETAIERLLHAPAEDAPADVGQTVPDAGNPIQTQPEPAEPSDDPVSQAGQTNE